jgi:hypothetical protein
MKVSSFTETVAAQKYGTLPVQAILCNCKIRKQKIIVSGYSARPGLYCPRRVLAAELLNPPTAGSGIVVSAAGT